MITHPIDTNLKQIFLSLACNRNDLREKLNLKNPAFNGIRSVSAFTCHYYGEKRDFPRFKMRTQPLGMTHSKVDANRRDDPLQGGHDQ